MRLKTGSPYKGVETKQKKAKDVGAAGILRGGPYKSVKSLNSINSRLIDAQRRLKKSRKSRGLHGRGSLAAQDKLKTGDLLGRLNK